MNYSVLIAVHSPSAVFVAVGPGTSPARLNSSDPTHSISAADDSLIDASHGSAPTMSVSILTGLSAAAATGVTAAVVQPCDLQPEMLARVDSRDVGGCYI
ncbi:hypothetical protein DIJ64_11470 [Mycobacterium leprae]|uniref:Uncharacterized protein n=1 Tax=Mycobacterium leprae TaxID=1769 RepID=A0AAD0P8N1_MYCLR|nr:hypothetical protein DIJ64_11470 [Mycobacterium leprae]OAR20182.1 hypothetical protein A8144_11850 [Mycobacterium leprae 3125609]OAX70558.1 hypothetical protein A3216_11255 [Mycobacterium leprae 7935681]